MSIPVKALGDISARKMREWFVNGVYMLNASHSHKVLSSRVVNELFLCTNFVSLGNWPFIPDCKDSRLFYSLQLNFNVRTESPYSQGTKIRRSLTLYLSHIFCSRPLLSGHKLQYCTQRADTTRPRFPAAFAKWSLNVQTAMLSASAQIKTENLIAET